MKTNALIPTLLLAALCAAPASAQVVSMSVPVNPVMGLPKSLPSPLSGPLVGSGISLPTLVVLPSISLAALPAAPALAAYSAPVAYVPERIQKIPRVDVIAGRENRANPFRNVLPDGVTRFDGASDGKSDKDGKADQDRLNQIFDGEGQPAERPTVELPRRAPVKPARRHSLPEWDLENELGLSSH